MTSFDVVGNPTADLPEQDLLLSGLQHSPVALGLLRRTGEVVSGNAALRDLLGDGVMHGRTGLWQLLHADDLRDSGSVIANVASGEARDARVRVRLQGQGTHDRWIDVRVTGIIDRRNVSHLLFVCILDVSDDMHALSELEAHAHHDDLTGLLNRGAVMRALDDAVARSGAAEGRIAVILCDIDRFKQINDTYGHVVGDAVIRTVADRLRGQVRNGDLVARLGGDEMLVLLAGITSASQARQIAEHLRTAVSRPMRIGEIQLHTSMSMGVALVDGQTAVDDVIARADAAMYVAKARGRNAVVLDVQDLGHLAV